MKYTLISYINWILAVFAFVAILSCDKDQTDGYSEEDITSTLMSNKWCGTYDDFGTWGDDEMSLDAYDYTLFFVTNTEGFMHYVRNSADTHFGSSKESGNTKFQYSVSGKDVTLYYGKSSETLTYQNFALVGKSSLYTPASISSSDRDLISTVYKTAGGGTGGGTGSSTEDNTKIDHSVKAYLVGDILPYGNANLYSIRIDFSAQNNLLSRKMYNYNVEITTDGYFSKTTYKNQSVYKRTKTLTYHFNGKNSITDTYPIFVYSTNSSVSITVKCKFTDSEGEFSCDQSSHTFYF